MAYNSVPCWVRLQWFEESDHKPQPISGGQWIQSQFCLDLTPLPSLGSKSQSATNRFAEIRRIHKQVRDRIKDNNNCYGEAANRHQRQGAVRGRWAWHLKCRRPKALCRWGTSLGWAYGKLEVDYFSGGGKLSRNIGNHNWNTSNMTSHFIGPTQLLRGDPIKCTLDPVDQIGGNRNPKLKKPQVPYWWSSMQSLVYPHPITLSFCLLHTITHLNLRSFWWLLFASYDQTPKHEEFLVAWLLPFRNF